ncbi:MAG: hypothetical protein M1830_008980, partial [Pleopsidium flavum]
MDVVGTAASLITIIDVALRVAKAARNLYEDVEGAPVELRNVSNKLELVHSLLQQLLALRPELRDGAEEFLPLDFRLSLATALEQTSHAIKKANSVCRYRGGKVGVHTRLRWALIEKASMDKALVHLRGAESSLMVALQLLEL